MSPTPPTPSSSPATKCTLVPWELHVKEALVVLYPGLHPLRIIKAKFTLVVTDRHFTTKVLVLTLHLLCHAVDLGVLGINVGIFSLSRSLLCKPDDPLCMLLSSVVCSPGNFTGIVIHFLILEAAPDFKTPTLLLHSLVNLHVPPPGLPLPPMILQVTTNLFSSTIKSALEVVPDLLKWLRSWVYYLPTRTLLELGLKFRSTGWVSKFLGFEVWSRGVNFRLTRGTAAILKIQTRRRCCVRHSSPGMTLTSWICLCNPLRNKM